MALILVVDDEAPLRRLLRSVLKDDGHEVMEADGVGSALEVLEHEQFDLVLTDQKMGRERGTDLIARCSRQDASLPVVMITAYASVELAVEAMRAGAFDFISKPFEPEVVRSCVRRAAEQSQLRRDNRRLRGEIAQLRAGDFVGVSPPMLALKEQLLKVAPTKATVLIQGETGSGKELVARAIHEGSGRAAASFIAVNCAALSETLLESELFGHERGAFTGADQLRVGVFEAAHGGTLFLDEAGDMPAALQVKLLRVLMDGRFTRVGSTQERRADVRLLVASHRDLREAVSSGTFREDLYYRLAVVTLFVPPLRERAEDVEPLSRHLLQRTCGELGIATKRLSGEAEAALRGYRYPGNVRELRNILERAAILSEGETIGLKDLPSLGPGGERSQEATPEGLARLILSRQMAEGGLRGLMEKIECAAVVQALAESGGVQAEAARQLGMSRSDLFYRVQKYGLGSVGGGEPSERP